MQTQQKYPRSFSFEFFPPKTPEGVEKLRATWSQLAQLKPRFFSVTLRRRRLDARAHARDRARDPPGGARSGAAPLVHRLVARRHRGDAGPLPVARGIRHIVALRGDLPSGTARARASFRYANELVEFIRAHTGDWFHIEVACYPEFHPQAQHPARRSAHFKRKVEAGANSAITQYFFNADAYFRFVDECEALGLDRPDRAGHHADRQFRAARALLGRVRRRDPALDPPASSQSFGDDTASIRAFGLDVVTELCDRLLAQRRAGPALLHHEPGGADDHDLAAARALGHPA